MIVAGSVTMRDRFRALGEIRIAGAKIGGPLECADDLDEAGSGTVLRREHAEIAGGIHRRGGTRR